MRLTRIAAADLRRDPAALVDAMKAQGFFPGARVVLVEDATDGLAPVFKAALDDWAPGDAMIVSTAGALNTRSALRKLFEVGRKTYAAALYNDPPGRGEVEAELARAGLRDLPDPAMTALVALAQVLGPGDFRQTVEKIALYKRGDPSPLSEADIEACAPASTEAAVDEILDVVAEGRTADIAPVMQRLWAQGTAPVTLMIFGMRRFRALYTVVSAPGGAAQGIGALRPPVFGPRRDRMLRQAGKWTPAKLDDALTILMDTDLKLRSAGQKAPTGPLVERALVRLAYLARR
jgi:DNA polymerase-3 subunit delta